MLQITIFALYSNLVVISLLGIETHHRRKKSCPALTIRDAWTELTPRFHNKVSKHSACVLPTGHCSNTALRDKGEKEKKKKTENSEMQQIVRCKWPCRAQMIARTKHPCSIQARPPRVTARKVQHTGPSGSALMPVGQHIQDDNHSHSGRCLPYLYLLAARSGLHRCY